MKTIQSLRGMKDITQNQSKLFTYFLDIATQTAKRYGFEYLETPLLEETALFKRSVGQSSDIVNKEMYQFFDKGDNDVCLRPEGTAGVVRSFIQNKLDKAGTIQRYFYHGPMFRYERPQKGRLREFHQFGCESFGVDSIYEDANIIMMVHDILSQCGIEYKLLLNSLGCQECMPKYRNKLLSFLETKSLCSDCITRKGVNPIRVLDCKNDNCQKELYNAPKITHNLCEKCSTDFDALQKILQANNIPFEIDPNLVRGLDYYTQTAFEFVSDNIGAQSALAGGGRYDRLVEFLGGKATPAIGFAIGIQRLLELIEPSFTQHSKYYIGILSKEASFQAFSLAHSLRKEDEVFLEYKPKGFTKHLKSATKNQSTHMILLGEDELHSQKASIKHLATQKEEQISLKDLLGE